MCSYQATVWLLQIAQMRKLMLLNVSYTGLTGRGILQITGGCPALQAVLIHGCRISTSNVVAILRQRRRLRIWEGVYPTLAPTALTEVEKPDMCACNALGQPESYMCNYGF